jgi:cAMP-dependent protein kinase regulator
MRGKH